MPLLRSFRSTTTAWAFVAIVAAGAVAPQHASAEVSDLRRTPIVRAVEAVRPSVVNIQGQKTVANTGEASRQVNGMGTGVVIDARGYILTNHHVVDGVRRIRVGLDDGQVYTARLIAHDRTTDLAVIKVDAGRPLPTITIGTSSDLMTAEPVIAVGNAYGYDHTVTRGIISALHRDVQVSETQAYKDLIQTDASINPGNSGGPLLSIEGKMIGVNVAVRAGAQGIGFAIPVDDALEIAARLMSVEKLENHWHGLETASIPASDELVVRRVLSGSPAAVSGLLVGDVIERVGDIDTHRSLDLERALLGQRSGAPIGVEVLRDGKPMQVTMAITQRGTRARAIATADEGAWRLLGMTLDAEPSATFASLKTRYRGGMRVVDVRRGGPADQQGIVSGDILVGMHRWETSSTEDIRYIVDHSTIATMDNVKFYVLRGDDTLFGYMNLAAASNGKASR
ncbi:putative serine protease HhoB precursor [Pseudobythopirellula maris]|uniref:Putative serine protease HhoB n=1 Tax=Pseudobythopirellula maris TaxID=2527991 RepID=A0A5C5ZW68_9BACT|nr:trypsin-like peptidase domain-containing protein [Pseudobythopirellula maris]TWT90503.1 putative serine protease HhoB precursor [Pseudobythopirellula maris]